MRTKSKITLISLLVIILVSVFALPATAQEATLSNNTGDGNSLWFTSGEPSLIMNGFDLTPLNLALPVVVESVSISMTKVVPDQAAEVLVYQDANGGSPSDAKLVGRAETTITQPGVFTYTFAPPITVTDPVIWVGFYLPIDSEFQADTSGTSVLTYWAWTPGGRFDAISLANAEVFGPGDGTAPVNIDMKGIARITARVRVATEGEVAQALSTVQTVGGTDVNLMPPLRSYDYCSPVLIDTEDEAVTLQEKIDFYCDVTWPGYSPPTPQGYERRGFLYNIFVFGEGTENGQLPADVTHCIRPAPEDLETAIIAVAKHVPRQWYFFPTQRYGDLICAEINHVGLLSYFVPVGEQNQEG